jgi:hypothetical protein
MPPNRFYPLDSHPSGCAYPPADRDHRNQGKDPGLNDSYTKKKHVLGDCLFTPLYDNIFSNPPQILSSTQKTRLLSRADADEDKDHRYNTGRKINIQIRGASPIPCDDAHPTNTVLVWPLAHYSFVPSCMLQCRDAVQTKLDKEHTRYCRVTGKHLPFHYRITWNENYMPKQMFYLLFGFIEKVFIHSYMCLYS